MRNATKSVSLSVQIAIGGFFEVESRI